MTRALRQRHRVIVLAMGILFPIAFAMAIAARKTVPILDALPAALASPAGPFEPVAWNGAGLFAKAPVEARLLHERGPSGRLALELSAPKDFVKPDLIVYWAPGNPHLSHSLPEDATLLGGFGSGALLLPPETAASDGVLVLYGLAENEIIDVSKPLRLRESR